MKNILSGILFLLTSIATYGKQYDTIIVPVTLDKLQDEIISKDVFSILNRKSNVNLCEYKTKRKGNLVTTRYKSDGWSFYVDFSVKQSKKNKECI